MDSEDLGPEVHPNPKRRKTFHQGSHPTRQHNNYTIAWICALYIEMAVAKAMLDEIHETPPNDANDTNTYVLGSINKHNIVIAGLPEGQYGTISAATIATNIKRTFSGIRMALIVGIGGGVPSKKDIRLGDVVVGTRIMQYDLLKVVADGKYERIAIPRTYPPLLGTTLTSLRAKHEISPSRVPSILHRKLHSHIKYSQPSVPDRLFQATYEHTSEASSCDFCDQSKLISRSRRLPGTIEIHYGGIASGNQVIKHGLTRDNIARELDILSFEMEAAGPMDIIPCLPIRGICDYSDSHKNKEWQRYAAATAAAYTRELIEELPAIQEQPAVAFSPDLNHNIPQNHRQLLMKSLEFKQMHSRRMTIKENDRKTCQWLLDHGDYKVWLDPTRLKQHSGFLWISGKPGAGKSTIMKFVYSNMKKACRGNNRIASFFFNARGEPLEKSTSGMYQSLLLQLLQEYRDLQTILDNPDILLQYQEECPPLNVLKDLFRDAISALGHRRFTCFVDALDECDEQQVMDMVEFFEDLAEQATDHDIQFRICFSSRHYPYIVLKHGIRLTLEEQSGHTEDLKIYIKSHLRFNDALLIEELLPELLRKAAGVFMWVVLVVQILNEEDRQGGLALGKRLAEIPSDLSKLFKDILTRDTKSMDSLLLSIRWMLYAERPLQPEEFRHALWSGLSLIKNRVDSRIPAGSHNRNSLDKIVISSSKGLAEITRSESPTVQFIHESVRDFLLRDNGLNELWPGMETDWKSSSHEELKKCCIFYLNQFPASSIECLVASPHSTIGEDISNKYPFLKYAAQSILYHANAAAEAVVQNEFLSEFPIARWIKTNNHFEKHKIREYTLAASLLYILADKGYPNLVRTCLKEDSQIHIYGERYHYPLFAALAGSNKETVTALLKPASNIINDINIAEGLKNRKDLKRYKNRTPLSWAAQEGRLDITKLLLGTGSALNELDGEGKTGLLQASENGHEAVARLLIENGADINIIDMFGLTALHYALQKGHETVARLLIEEGANFNIIDLPVENMISQMGARTQSLYDAIRNNNTAAALRTHPDIPDYFLAHENIVLVRHNFRKPDNWKNQDPPIQFYPYNTFGTDHPIDHEAHSDEARSLQNYVNFDAAKKWMHPRGRTIYVATFIKRWADGGVIPRKMPETGRSAFGIFGLRGIRRVYEPHPLYVNDYDFNPPWRNGWGTDVYEFEPKPNGEPYPHVILLTHQHSSCSENSILRAELEVIVTAMRNRANQLVGDGEENSACANQRKLQFPYESRFPVPMISVYAPTNIRIYYACMDNLRLHIRQSGTWEATALSNDFNFLAMVFLSNAHSGFHQPPVIQPLPVIPPRPSQQLMSSRGSTMIRAYISPRNPDMKLGGPTTIDPKTNPHSKKSLN